MVFDKKTRKQVADHLNRTIFQEKVEQLVRHEIERFEARGWVECSTLSRNARLSAGRLRSNLRSRP
jgi:hypothetical protein